MTTLFVRPRGPQFYKTIGPDLGFGYLETALNREGRDAVIVDLMRRTENDLRQVLRSQPFGAVGFKLYSKDAHDYPRLTKLVTDNVNGLPRPAILAGGPLPTGMRDEFLRRFPETDFAFAGESEAALPMLVRHLEGDASVSLADVPGLIWRDGSEIRVNPQAFPLDLDDLGFPEFTQMSPSAYPMDYTGHVYVPMVTTRGCPYHCTYCAAPLNNSHRLRRRSPDHVLEEMRRLKTDWKVTMVSIVDDNFTMNPSHARGVLQAMIDSDIGLFWRAPNGIRLDTLNRELIELMERSGCRELYLGVESGSPRVLDEMKRRVTVETYREKVDLLARYSKIRLLGFFMMGYPTETEEDLRMTSDLANSLPIHRAAFFYFTPHPGTEIHDEMRDNGEISDDMWSSLFYDKPTIGTRNVSLKSLQQWQRRAYRRFYARPRILLGLFAGLSGPSQVLRLIRKIAGTALGV